MTMVPAFLEGAIINSSSQNPCSTVSSKIDRNARATASTRSEMMKQTISGSTFSRVPMPLDRPSRARSFSRNFSFFCSANIPEGPQNPHNNNAAGSRSSSPRRSIGAVNLTYKKEDNWVGYRPQIKVVDCTIRDGGLINNHQFSDEFVRLVYEANLAAGVDYMEFGYKGSPKVYSPDKYGCWRYCREEDLRRVVGDNPDPALKLTAMADAERTDYKNEILPKKDSVLSMIRVATYIHQVPTAVDMIVDAHEKGYETTCNLMAVSTVQERELVQALEILAKCPVDVIYVVDSYGSMYSEQIRDLVRLFHRSTDGKQLGVHCHNNQQLAYANTIEAILGGVNYLDATISGLGRGAGNCPIELLLGFLRNPKFDQRPIIEAVEHLMLPLSHQLDWGYSIPYMISGQLNRHPREAMALREGESKDKYVDFYDQMMQ